MYLVQSSTWTDDFFRISNFSKFEWLKASGRERKELRPILYTCLLSLTPCTCAMFIAPSRQISSNVNIIPVTGGRCLLFPPQVLPVVAAGTDSESNALRPTLAHLHTAPSHLSIALYRYHRTCLSHHYTCSCISTALVHSGLYIQLAPLYITLVHLYIQISAIVHRTVALV